MSTERSRSRSPTIATTASRPLYRDGRSDRMMKRAPPVRAPGQQMRVRGRLPSNYRSRDSYSQRVKGPDNNIDGIPWNSRNMPGRRELLDDMYADEEYYDDHDECNIDFKQNSGDDYKDMRDDTVEYPKRYGFQSRRGRFESQREGFESQRGGFESRRGGFESRRGGFESQRGGFESQRGGFESRRGTGIRSEEYGHSRPQREEEYDSYGEYPRQGGFKSRGRFDMSYPDENGQENRENRVETRPGDWTCIQCFFSNFASRTSCYKCQKDKGEGAPETLDLKKWECTECFASNHERRFECFKCQKAKPKNAKECAELSDWDCPNCQSNNAARRTNCGRCDTARPGREKELEANPDWKCGGCGIMNWSWREGCYKCHANKADGKIPEGAPQDWECKDCGKSNWARRNQCFGCRAEKTG